jgi:flagellar hook-associated protein 3 FlgL
MTASYFSRIGTSNAYDRALQNISYRQSGLAELQENLTSGKKVLRSSDDPTGAALAERALTRINRVQADQRALEAQRNSIATAESTLGEVVDRMQEFRELIVQAGNGSYTSAERRIISQKLNSLREHILDLSNRSDSNGMPLFAGLGSDKTPFAGPTALPNDYTYKGLPGQSSSTVNSIPYALDGDSAFMFHAPRDGIYNVKLADNTGIGAITAPRSVTTDTVKVLDSSKVNQSSYSITINSSGPGATAGTLTTSYTITETDSDGIPLTPVTVVSPDYPANQPLTLVGVAGNPGTMDGISINVSGQLLAGDTITINPKRSIFSSLDDAIRDIGGAVNGNASSQSVRQALHAIDAGLNRIMAVRGQAGELLNRADRITDSNNKLNVELEANRSRAEDLDMVKGISEFQNNQTGYQAALQSYAQVKKLSLFDYIR